MFGSPLCAVGTKLFLFAFFVGCMIFLSGRHPRRVSPQPSSCFNFLCVFVVEALCFSFELNSCPYFAARGFLVGLRGTCNAGVFFRSCWWHLAVSALSVCTPSSLPLRASCCSGMFCLISLALFVSPAPPWLAPAWSRMVSAWATVMDSRFLSTSCWNPWGCEHRDGFWLGFFLPSLLPSAGCSFFPPDEVRASSLWHVLRILTLFLALTGTMALHALKLDGVSASARHVWRDLMVSFVCLSFCSPLLSFEVASVPGRFLHGTQDPEFCARWSCCVSARSVFRCFLSQLSSCLQFVSLFPGTHLEFSSVGAFCWSMFFFLVCPPHAWSRNVTSVYGIFFIVVVFSVLVLGRFSRPVPLLSPAVAGVGATSVLLRNVWRCLPRIRPNSGIEIVSLRWLIGTINSCSTLGCISHALALSYFGVVAIAVSSCYCLWIYSVSSRDFSVCLSGEEFWVDSFLCGVAAVLQLDTLHVAMMLLQPPRGSCCFLVQLLSVIPLSLRLRCMVLSFRSIGCAQMKMRTRKRENCDKKKRRKKNKQKRWHIRKNEKRRRTTIKM